MSCSTCCRHLLSSRLYSVEAPPWRHTFSTPRYKSSLLKPSCTPLKIKARAASSCPQIFSRYALLSHCVLVLRFLTTSFFAPVAGLMPPLVWGLCNDPLIRRAWGVVGGELAVRSIAAPPPFVAGDWRVDEKLYMSCEPSCLGNGVDREGELAGEGFARLVVGDAVFCCPRPASTEGRVCCCLSGEACCCCCCARLRLRVSGGVCCLTLDRRGADGM